ncbi:MAG: hypothetical protein J5J06_01675 [Phycisphaerae bacterium]|nr:hypothetical protein [Phycisphaerae bacterium]
MKRVGVYLVFASAAVAAIGNAAWAQDSVSNTGCLPGDGVSPWDTTELKNDYVVDLVPLTTSWGTRFGIAPLIKASKADATFFGSLTGAQSMSRTQLTNTALSGTFDLWTTAGEGINAAENDAPASSVDLTGLQGNQFSVAFTEFSNSYNGVIGAIVQYEAENPGRLYVSRIAAASNSCDATTNLSQYGMGTVDAAGNIHIRTDDFGVADGCGQLRLAEENLLRVNMSLRDPAKINLTSNYRCGGTGAACNEDADCGAMTCDPPSTADAGATDWLIRNSTEGRCGDGAVCDVVSAPSCVVGTCQQVTYGGPNILPGSSPPVYFGLNSGTEYARGTTNTTIVKDASHFAAGVVDQRGSMGYTHEQCAWLNSTAGVAAHLGRSAAGLTDRINVVGLDANGEVTGTLNLILPAVVKDNKSGFCDGTVTANLDTPCFDFVGSTDCPAGELCEQFTNLTQAPDVNEFDHYHSQVAFRGGNSQVALGVDADGNLLVAAVVDQPFAVSASPYDWPCHYIAVARVNCDTGSSEWTMAGFNDIINSRGKPILDGPSPAGTPVGRLGFLYEVTGGTPQGPSFTSPMMDSAGNIWFLAATETFGAMDPFDTALIRAVYDKDNFGYDLERVFQQGFTFRGANSDRRWQIGFMNLADSNSIDSGTAWSQNISGVAVGNEDPATLAARDPRTLGGVIINAEITYDWDDNGMYEFDCSLSGSNDQEYRAILYVGSITRPAQTPSTITSYPHGALKQRYISFRPDQASAGLPHGYQVTDVGSGQSYYISSPRTTPASIAGQGLTFLVSDGTPPLADFGALPFVHVGGCMIAPGDADAAVGRAYEVRATQDGLTFTAPLTVYTAARPTTANARLWADVVGGFSAGGDGSTTPPTPANSWTPPNRNVSGFDISATLQGVSSLPSAPHFTWCDVNPERTDRVVIGPDVLRVVNAFSVGSGREYYPYAYPQTPTVIHAPTPPTPAVCPAPPLESALTP